MFGAVRCKIDSKSYYLGSPTAFQLFVANEIYEDSLNMAEESGLLFENEVFELMMSIGKWSKEEQDILDKFPEKIEKTKLELYDYQLRINDFKLCKKRLEIYRLEQLELLNKKYALNYITAEGFASFCKVNYLMGAGLRDSQFKPVWQDERFFDDHSGILDEIRYRYNMTRINDAQIRELARTDPWRFIWSTGNKANMFNRHAVDMTEEQRNLVAWSKLYDNLHETLEPPSETVIQDDDLLDAWLILQKKKREDKSPLQPTKEMRISKNDKINNAQNVFIMMGDDVCPITGKKIQMISNPEEAKKLDELLNGPEARAIKKMRFEAMDNYGTLRHHNLPDVKHDLVLQRNNLEIQHKKGKLK